MSFSTFEISELSEESDEDYALEIQTGDTMLGILVSEAEMAALADGMQRTIDGSPEDADQLKAEDYEA